MMGTNPIDSPSIDEASSGGSSKGGEEGGEVGGGLLKKGPWTSIEDAILIEHVRKYGEGKWNAVQKNTGLYRCGKSCRLRWSNHLRPNLKKGAFTAEEEQLIIELHAQMGNKWARMATHLPGRTDNEIKNFWNTRIKRCQRAGLPLYPHTLCLKSLHAQPSENVEDLSSGSKRRRDYNADMRLESSKDNNLEGFSFVSTTVPVTTIHNFLTHASQHSGFENSLKVDVKRPRTSEASFRNFGTDSGHSMGYPSHFKKVTSLTESVIPGSHALNGKFSASQPLTGSRKSELPSLQYPEMDLCSWILCPPTTKTEATEIPVQLPRSNVSLQPSCPSPSNADLLEILLDETSLFSGAKHKLSSSSYLPVEMQQTSKSGLREISWAGFGDPISPLGRPAESIFSESTTPLSSSCLDDLSPSKQASGGDPIPEIDEPEWGLNAENGGFPLLDFTRSDALLDSAWLEEKTEAFSSGLWQPFLEKTSWGKNFLR